MSLTKSLRRPFAWSFLGCADVCGRSCGRSSGCADVYGRLSGPEPIPGGTTIVCYSCFYRTGFTSRKHMFLSTPVSNPCLGLLLLLLVAGECWVGSSVGRSVGPRADFSISRPERTHRPQTLPICLASSHFKLLGWGSAFCQLQAHSTYVEHVVHC
jgi:hypothetical protein